MTTVPDNADERQTRVDRMVDEFRVAQARRAARAAIAPAPTPPEFADPAQAAQPDIDIDTEAQAAVVPSPTTGRTP